MMIMHSRSCGFPCSKASKAPAALCVTTVVCFDDTFLPKRGACKATLIGYFPSLRFAADITWAEWKRSQSIAVPPLLDLD